MAFGWDFLGISDPHPGIGNGDFSFRDRSKNPRDCVFSNFGSFIPGIGDFSKSGKFYPGDWGFFEIWGFFSPGIGDFFQIWGFLSRRLGIFIPRIRDF